MKTSQDCRRLGAASLVQPTCAKTLGAQSFTRPHCENTITRAPPLEKPSHPSPKSPQFGLVATSQTIGAEDIHAAITQLATAIAARHGTAKKLLLLGIANGGVTLAHRLSSRLSTLNAQLSTSTGTVDISFHRDDILRHPIPKEFVPTHIPSDVHGATVILVDDVLFSGRTVKAALDELFDHGRPAKVELAVLVDRAGRLMPVAADYTGIYLTTAPDEKVIVTLDAKSPRLDSIRVESPAASRPAASAPAPSRIIDRKP